MQSKKRVAIVYMLTHSGGVQSCVLALIRKLNTIGIIPDILWDQPPCTRLLAEANAQAVHVPVSFKISTRLIQRLPETIRYLAWIANVHREKQTPKQYDHYYIFYNGFIVSPNVSHLYYLSGPPLLPQLVVTPSGWKGLPIRIFRKIYMTSLRKRWPVYEFHINNRYVINSKFTKSLFREAHGVDLPVVYPPVRIELGMFDNGDVASRDTLLFFSRMADYKRPEVALQLAQRHPNLRFVCMGGVTSNWKKYAKQLEIDANTLGINAVFLQNPSNEEVNRELKRTKFYVFPAINEHFGMTTPEAIAAGAIPFVHDSGGQREIVPLVDLRFTDANVFSKFEWLSRQSNTTLEAMRAILVSHIAGFSEERFCDEMLNILGIH